MELNAVRSQNTFRAQNNSSTTTKKSYSTQPAIKLEQQPDEFISSTNAITTNPTGLWGKIFGKIKDVATHSSKPETQEKINKARLTKLFVQNGSMSISEISKNSELLEILSKQDFNKVSKKYKAIINNIKDESGNKKPQQYKADIKLSQIDYPLFYRKLEAEDVNEIYKIKHSRPNYQKAPSSERLDLNHFTKTLDWYDHFDILPANTQKRLMNSVGYDNYSYNSITAEEAENIPENSSLMKFDFINDLKSTQSNKEVESILNERRKNIPCKTIPVNQKAIDKVFSKNGIDNLTEALYQTDLTKYKKGFPLEYPRKDFINDFNKLIENLPIEKKKKVFDYFQFKINADNDIINFPNPNTDDNNIDESILDITNKGQELIEKFMLQNKVKLDKKDKMLEVELNNLIKAYPEFISVMGKIQHRGDSIDFHTMDDMKREFNTSDFQNLPEKEQTILATATLFHDFGKVQGVLDVGHARKSAIAAKEIIKKTNYSLDDKERIYNLINHSHWLVDGSTSDDIAFAFRRPKDFEMAEIFERADCNSAGFEYNPPIDRMQRIHGKIKRINTTGIPIFANNLPTEDKYFDKTPSGIRYLDLRDPDMPVEKYGYPVGTRVKDLKFLCHSSNDTESDFKTLCDDSKEVCLSTSLLDYRKRFTTGYNSFGDYIVSGNNANIILGGKDLACTGGHRGYEYAKEMTNYDHPNYQKERREEIPTKIRDRLNLSQEEYTELFSKICNAKSLEDIKDVTLSNGEEISKETIQHTINDIQRELIRPKELGESGYTNEFVVYNPKVEGVVLQCSPEELESRNLDKDNVYVLA